MPAKIIRFPFQKDTKETEWVEIPFDASDPDSDTLKARVRQLPVQKRNELKFLLRRARRDYWTLLLRRDAARDRVGKEIKEKKEAFLQALEKISIKKETQGEIVEMALSILGTKEVSGDTARASALSKVDAEFGEQEAKALAEINKVRREIVRCGITGHTDFEGEFVDEEGNPLLDDKGKPIVQPIPFGEGTWEFDGRKENGCPEETLDLYQEASPNNGLLLGLSLAVLLFNAGEIVTPARIFSENGVKKAGDSRPLAKKAKKAKDTKPPKNSA